MGVRQNDIERNTPVIPPFYTHLDSLIWMKSWNGNGRSGYNTTMFTFLKLIKPLFLPPGVITIALAVGIILLIRKKIRTGITIVAAVLVFFYFLSIEPVTFLLVRSLERTVPGLVKPANLARGEALNDPEAGTVDPDDFTDVGAIVTLSGGAGSPGPSRPFPELELASWRRFWHGLEVYWKLGGRIRIIFSGGSSGIFSSGTGGAEIARNYALTIGVPPQDFLIDNTSRNTFENGRETKRILRDLYPRRTKPAIILVTSSIHMPRSILVMKKQGLEVIPAPADFPFHSLDITPLSFLPSASLFKYSTDCIHEWLGILAYKLLGRI